MVSRFHIFYCFTIQKLVFQWKVGHVLRLLFFRQKSAQNGDAKCAEKKDEGGNAKPLDTFYGLK
jgi:hypothetical protein